MIYKNFKDLVSASFWTPGTFNFCKTAQDLNNIKQNPEHPFADIGKWDTCEKFPQKIFNSMATGERLSFQLFR